jgi:hypothetical protein
MATVSSHFGGDIKIQNKVVVMDSIDFCRGFGSEFYPFLLAKGFLVNALWSIALGGSLAAIVWLVCKHQSIHYSHRIPSGDILMIIEYWLWLLLNVACYIASRLLKRGSSSSLTSMNARNIHPKLMSLLYTGENIFR